MRLTVDEQFEKDTDEEKGCFSAVARVVLYSTGRTFPDEYITRRGYRLAVWGRCSTTPQEANVGFRIYTKDGILAVAHRGEFTITKNVKTDPAELEEPVLS